MKKQLILSIVALGLALAAPVLGNSVVLAKNNATVSVHGIVRNSTTNQLVKNVLVTATCNGATATDKTDNKGKYSAKLDCGDNVGIIHIEHWESLSMCQIHFNASSWPRAS